MADDIDVFMSRLPEHACELSLTHNECRSSYETVAQMVTNGERYPGGRWVSEDQKAKAIATNDYWCLHWYPRTPVSFCVLLACDLDVLLKAAT